ncbi:homeobox protein knotted-1 [Trifolium repens]|nr:homeobox protein knotted-1 [Trifolium repens]
MEGKDVGGRNVEGINVGKKNENEKDEEILKKIIASHPLFEVMIESHINCLKVGSEDGGIDIISDAWKKLVNTKSKAAISPNTSELDHFMEAYCMALSNLKEVIEEPTKEAKSFINATYIQLQELNEPNNEPAT